MTRSTYSSRFATLPTALCGQAGRSVDTKRVHVMSWSNAAAGSIEPRLRQGGEGP